MQKLNLFCEKGENVSLSARINGKTANNVMMVLFHRMMERHAWMKDSWQDMKAANLHDRSFRPVS